MLNCVTIWEFIIITDSNNKASLQHATQPELFNYDMVCSMHTSLMVGEFHFGKLVGTCH